MGIHASTFLSAAIMPVAVAAAMLAPASALADTNTPVEIQKQKLLDNHRLIALNGDTPDSSAVRERIAQFYNDQFRHAQDPRAPYFMLMSRNGNMAMGIGGMVKVIGAYDWDGSIDGLGFAPYSIPIPRNPEGNTAFQASPAKSALFFTVFGNDKRFGDYKIYIEAKFSKGNNYSFGLGKAYATVGDWTLGYANTTFCDPGAQPSTIDTDGPNSEVDYSTVLLRYMHTFRQGITLAVSAESPDSQVPASSLCSSTKDFMPDIAAFAQYSWASGQHIRLSGIARGLRYRDLVSETNHKQIGWGLHLSTAFRPVAPLTIYAAGITGRGIGSIVNDLQDGENDLLPYSDRPGRMYAPQSYGWYAAAQYNFTPSLFSTIIFSQQRILPESGSDYGGDQYKYGLYATANIFWDITPRCQVGAEYNMGRRCNIDGTARNGYRISLLAQLSF